MSWTWTGAFDQLWHSSAFPMWATLAIGVLFSLVLLVTFFRADGSIANGALAVISLLAIGFAVAATLQGFEEAGVGKEAADLRTPQPFASLPALSCLDGLAGEIVEEACESALFASAESSAAGVSYTAAQMTRLASFGSEFIANSIMTPELAALRRALERDRYGLVAHVLGARDGCTLSDCVFYKYLSNHNQIAVNMTDRTYQGLIARYSPGWHGTVTGSATAGGLPASVPSGKPVSGDFPSSTSIPAVSIMTAEPAMSPAFDAAGSKSMTSPSTRAQPVAPRAVSAHTVPKKQVAKKNSDAPSAAPAPLPLVPPPPVDDN